VRRSPANRVVDREWSRSATHCLEARSDNPAARLFKAGSQALHEAKTETTNKDTVRPFKTVLLMSTFMAGSTLAATINFNDATPGETPPGWTVTKTGTGEAKWTIERDDTAPSKPNVLKQSGEATYPVALKNGTNLKDGFVEVKFKPISGKEDQAGGVIWRARDADNYYVARANALENNVTIYHTVKGKRSEKKRISMKVASGEWHTFRVDFSGKHFTVTCDGMKAIEWDDETFTDGGMVGLWTKADSVTLFDDFTYSGK
jgi:hypothetical protein